MGGCVRPIFGNEMSDGYHLKLTGQGPIMGLGQDSPSTAKAPIVGLVTRRQHLHTLVESQSAKPFLWA